MKERYTLATIDRHPFWLAAAYLAFQLAFLVLFRLYIRRTYPWLADATWQDPRVWTAVIAVLMGSVGTAGFIYLAQLRSWHPLTTWPLATRSKLLLYPVASGFCTLWLVPMSITFYLVHGPLFAIVVLRGTGFLAARLVDELLLRRGLTKRRVSRREDGVVLLVAIAIWLGIVIPSDADPVSDGRLFTQAWLFPTYIAAYTLRLWFINVYSIRWKECAEMKPVAAARIPFFLTFEQAVLTCIFVPAAFFYMRTTGAHAGALPDSPLTVLSLATRGIPLGLSAVAAVAILLIQERTATHNFTLYRIAASLASIGAAVLLYILPHGGGHPVPAPERDLLLAGVFVFSLFLLHGPPRKEDEGKERLLWPPLVALGKVFWDNVRFAMATDAPPVAAPALSRVEGEPQAQQKEPAPPERTVLRFARFVFVIAVLVFIAPGTNAVLRIISNSPYHTNVNPIAVIGEILYSSAASALPVFAIFALLYFVFQTRGAPRDAAVLVDHGEEQRPSNWRLSQEEWWRIDTAAKRITLAVGVMSGLIGLGVWMQGGIASRHAVTVSLTNQFGDATVSEGRRLLRANQVTVPRHDPSHCLVCEALRAHLRGDTLAFVTVPDRAPLCDLRARDTASARDSLRVVPIVTALNAIEVILEARRTAALSEIEFHSVWAGVSREILDNLQAHLDGNPDLYDTVATYLPMLCQQIRTQPWYSDTAATDSASFLSYKREMNHRRKPSQADSVAYDGEIDSLIAWRRIAYARAP
jgi:hypothetical protein